MNDTKIVPSFEPFEPPGATKLHQAVCVAVSILNTSRAPRDVSEANDTLRQALLTYADVEAKGRATPWFPYVIERATDLPERFQIARYNPIHRMQEVWHAKMGHWTLSPVQHLTEEEVNAMMANIHFGTKP